jgi:hypothetical protein
MNLNFESAKNYYKFGAEFEKIYYQNINNKSDVLDKLYKYQKLHDEINEYIITETIEHQNYITECIYYILINNAIAMKINSEKYSKWIPLSERHNELDGLTTEFNIKNGLKSVFAPLNFELLRANNDIITKNDILKRHIDNTVKQSIDNYRYEKNSSPQNINNLSNTVNTRTSSIITYNGNDTDFV